MKRNKRGIIELLETRRLLSVSAATLAGPTTPGLVRTYESLTNGVVTSTSTQTIKGPATFNGHGAIEADGTSTNSPGALVKSYFGFDASGNAVSYGSTGVISQGSFTIIDTPSAVQFPATIDPGKVLSFSWSTTESFPGGSFTSQTKHTIELSSATLQSVTVPAGTFNAYLFNLTDTITQNGFAGSPSTSQEWVVPNKGVVKTVGGAGTSVTELIPNTIVVGAPAKLGFSQQPLSAAVGTAMSPPLKVEVLDASGNLVANNTSTVTLSIFSGPTGGTLAGTLSATAVGGVATFANVSAGAVGSYVIQATDGALTLAKTTPIVISTTTGAAKLAFINSPTGGAAGAPLSLTVGVQTSSGQNVPTDSSKVTLSIASGPAGAVLSGTAGVNALEGVAHFSGLTLSKPGVYTLKASDGSLATAITAPFTLTAAVVASKVVYLGNQAGGTAGKPITPVAVAVETSTGSVVTSDSSQVTLSITSGPAGGTLTGTTAANALFGVASFNNLVFSQAGTYMLKATDGSLTPATVTVVITAPIIASKLAYLASPAAGTAGATLSSVTLAIESAAGVVIGSDTSKVTLAIASGPVSGTLAGTLAVSVVGGFATFSDLKFTMAGAYTLKATDGSLTFAISKPIVIAAAAASRLVIATQPLTGTAGKALAAITVKVEDAFGNVVTTNGSTVKLAAATFPVGGTVAGTLSAVAVQGVATFDNISMNVVGAYSLKATDGTLAFAVSKPIVISAAAPAKLVIATQPTTGIAGKALAAITVKVEDAFGNVVTTNSSTVKLAAATFPVGGAAAGTLSAVAVQGVATFTNISMNIAGAYTLKATDGTIVSTITKPITIAAAAAAKLVISQQPTTGKALVALTPALVVKIEDAFGNVVTTATSTVTLTLASGTAGQLAGTTAGIAVKGVATFANLSFKKAGTYTLKATDGVLTAAIWKAIVIT